MATKKTEETEEKVVAPEAVEETTPKEEAAPEETPAEATPAVVEEKNEVAVTEEKKDSVSLEDATSLSEIDLSEFGFTEEDMEELSGLNAVGSDEISIPYATLISKKTRDYDIGDIVFADGKVVKGLNGEVVEDIAILQMKKVRVYFPTPFNPKNSFVCRSLDGIHGAPDGEFPGRPCSECEFSKYPEGGGASPCRDQRLLLCATEDGGLFHLNISGLGVKVWKTFMSSQVMKQLPKARKILGALRVRMGVKTVESNYGPFPVLDFYIDAKNPQHPVSHTLANLNALKSYKEFEDQHIAASADQARVQMAAGEAEQNGSGNGENAEMF